MVFDEFGAIAKAILGVGLALAVGFIILASVITNIGTQENLINTNSSQCMKSAACNGTRATVSALGTIPGWLSLLVLVGVAGLILSLVRQLRS